MSSAFSQLTRRALCIGAAASAAAMACGVAAAESAYPSKPVKVIVTYAPGGANDVTARVYSQLLTERMKQPFVVENRPGASGITGTTSVARADADGYTVLLGAGGTMTINPGLFASLSYDPLRDFVPIGLAARSPLVVVVPSSLPVNNVSELVAYAKSRPQGISFASPGAGTPLHLAGELFARKAGVKMLHVPYKGSSPALTDLMGRRVDVMFDVLGTSLPHIRSGRLRPLAVTSLQRSSHLPEVPSLHEQGLRDFDVTSWFGLFAPKGTPPEVVRQLNAELTQAAKAPEAREKLSPLGMEPVSSSSEQLGKLVQSEQAKWREVIREAKIPLR